MARVADSLSGHHRHCNGLVARAREAARARDWAGYGATVARLAGALARHIAFEEDTLFPALEQVARAQRANIDVLRGEHAALQNALAQLRAAAPAHDPEGCCGMLEGFGATLGAHQAREEASLYPFCERLPEAQRAALAGEAAALARALGALAGVDPQPVEPRS